MSTYRINAHPVQAQQIVQVLPLIVGGDKILSPDQGILLRLDDSTKKKWLAEPNVPMPQPGDWLVVDPELAASFVVPAAKFQQMFSLAD